MKVNTEKVGIHPTALISGEAEFEPGVEIGPYSIIEDNVRIGENTKISSCVRIGAGTTIGKDCQIYHGAVVGGTPQDLKFSGESTTLKIGDSTVIREYATISKGTKHTGQTRVGSGCLLMAYSHIAHDCVVGDNVILANAVNLAGHVEIEDYAIIGGVVPVHQFVRIGAHSMIGGGFRVPLDICPYMLAAGYPLKIVGLNRVGLKRRGFSIETLKTLEQAYKILFRSRLNTSQALEKIKSELPHTSEIKKLFVFIEKSQRGITK